jgi:rfaE bifunctional protein kinase chain/domain
MKPEPSSRAWMAALARFPQARVLVVGDIMHDVFIWGRVRRISPEAPVPVVEVSRETSLLGGAANVVNNVRALGARAFLAGVIGRDPAGEAVLRALHAIGADATGVRKSPRRPTAVKTRIIAHHQQVVRFDKEEKRPLARATFEGLWTAIAGLLPRMDAVIVSDYAKGLVTAELMTRLLELARRKGKLVLVDPKPAHQDWYRGAAVLTPNHQEAAEMSGLEIETESDLLRAGEAILQKLECRALLITRGERGMSLFTPGKKPVHIPAQAREVYDVTGAGDTVISALTVALVAGLQMADAVKVSNLAGGIVVGKLGTSVATVDEIRAALKNQKK